MSKSVSKIKIPVSPDYRHAPVSFIENVIRIMIILAMGMAILFANDGQTLIGGLMFFGALAAYISVTLTRNAR
jgi:hypothetical protein